MVLGIFFKVVQLDYLDRNYRGKSLPTKYGQSFLNICKEKKRIRKTTMIHNPIVRYRFKIY